MKQLDHTTTAYLERLGLEAEPPSAQALIRLHRAHVEHVPYETLWIHLGQRWDIDPRQSMHRVAHEGRGGYCFHLNGAFSELLTRLGYTVHRHVGGVHGPGGPEEAEMTNHLVLTVHDLPSDANPDGVWYVDAGLGDALHEPIPLREGTYAQGPFTLGIESTTGGVGDWHLTHDPAGAFSGMSWRNAAASMMGFEQMHRHLSTSNESGFVRTVTVQRRDAKSVDYLRGRTLRRIGRGATNSVLDSRRELEDALTDIFRLSLSGIEWRDLEELWDRLLSAHEEWLKGQES